MEYASEELDRLAHEPGFRPSQWSSDVIKAYRKKHQLIVAAVDERDLRAIRSLRLKHLNGDREGTSSIRLNDQFRLILNFKNEGERVAVILELVDYH